MKTAIIASLILCGCATTQYKGQQLGYVVHSCYRAGATVSLLSTCVPHVFEQNSPNWRQDKDYPFVSYYLSSTDALGKAVTDKEITEEKAKELAANMMYQMIEYKRLRASGSEQANTSMFATGMAIHQNSTYPNPQPQNPRNCSYRYMDGEVKQTCM